MVTGWLPTALRGCASLFTSSERRLNFFSYKTKVCLFRGNSCADWLRPVPPEPISTTKGWDYLTGLDLDLGIGHSLPKSQILYKE